MTDVTSGGMYLVIPASVAEDVRLRERSKLIYGRIVQLAFSTGYCYASNRALLEILTHKDHKTGAVDTISERTLQSILAELRDCGSQPRRGLSRDPEADLYRPKIGRYASIGRGCRKFHP